MPDFVPTIELSVSNQS